MTRPRVGRLLSIALALAALSFVVWVVPVRDRCWDPRAPGSTRVAVSRDDAGCVLHLQTGPVRLPAPECAALRCEPGVASALGHARLGLLGALALLYALGTLPWAARWRALLAFAEIDISLLEVWRVSVEAQAGGILLPGGIGGDAFRVAAVLGRKTRSGERPRAALVLASLMLDRGVGLATMAGLAALLGFAYGGLGAGPLTLVLAAVPVGLVLALAVLRHAPVDRIGWLARGRLGGVVQPMLAYVRDPRAPRAIASGIALSVLVAGVQLATVRGLLFALGGEPASEKWIYVGTVMAFIVGAVPALPGGWGTADAAYVFFFGLAGIPVGTALAVCLLYRLFWYLSGAVGAILYVLRPAAPAAAPGPSPTS